MKPHDIDPRILDAALDAYRNALPKISKAGRFYELLSTPAAMLPTGTRYVLRLTMAHAIAAAHAESIATKPKD